MRPLAASRNMILNYSSEAPFSPIKTWPGTRKKIILSTLHLIHALYVRAAMVKSMHSVPTAPDLRSKVS